VTILIGISKTSTTISEWNHRQIEEAEKWCALIEKKSGCSSEMGQVLPKVLKANQIQVENIFLSDLMAVNRLPPRLRRLTLSNHVSFFKTAFSCFTSQVLTDDEIQDFVAAMNTQTYVPPNARYSPGDRVIVRNEAVKKLFFIAHGSVEACHREHSQCCFHKFGTGAYFGDIFLLKKQSDYVWR
jgi:hypothetical protein